MVRDTYKSEVIAHRRWIEQANKESKISCSLKPCDTESYELSTIYKNSNRLNRTNYKSQFDANGKNSFLELAPTETSRLHRRSSWFDQKVYVYDTNERMMQLNKPVLRRNSLDQRLRLSRQSQDYKEMKENGFSTIKAIEDLNEKTSRLIKQFKTQMKNQEKF